MVAIKKYTLRSSVEEDNPLAYSVHGSKGQSPETGRFDATVCNALFLSKLRGRYLASR